MRDKIAVDVLVVGDGTSAVSAAISASRLQAVTILATEFTWLGGMLTSAGVAAPDGNELEAWRTGMWGAYLHQLQQMANLNNSWVSLYSYHPALGAKIFADWVAATPNLNWISGCIPQKVLKKGDRITGVEFNNLTVEAKITIDATELGDLLALGNVPFRWGWDTENWQEPSLSLESNQYIDLPNLKEQYPVQSPTWVCLLQDYGDTALTIESKVKWQGCPWSNHDRASFLNYGKLTNDLYMINWPIAGNDYGKDLNRLVDSKTSHQAYLEEAYAYSLSFARYLQQELGSNYGLANVFPHQDAGFALYPYYRESRRGIGMATVTEANILPVDKVAPLPLNEAGIVDAIAIGNYPNDHHYPGIDWKLANKSTFWGGRQTGTPFTIPYSALIPQTTDGLILSEKNISVSHIANGSTRLQPVVLNIGQAAGVAGALAVKQNIQPRELDVRAVQQALIQDPIAPAGVIPLYNLALHHPQWATQQQYYLDHPEAYPFDGNDPAIQPVASQGTSIYEGTFYRENGQYQLHLTGQKRYSTWQLITINALVNQQLAQLKSGRKIRCMGSLNNSGGWLLVHRILE